MVDTLTGIPLEIDDAELVAAAQGGDRAALDQLLRRHYDRLHAVARRIAGGTRDADDACQEALIKIVRALPTFDGRSSFGTWAYRIATNAALDELRRRKRRPTLHVVDDEGDGPPDPIDELGQRQVESITDRLAIDSALAASVPEFRSAVVLRDVVDLDYGEIAEVLEIPVGTTTSRIARGRRLLADQLRIDDLPDLATDVTSETPEPPIVGNRAADFERPTDLT